MDRLLNKKIFILISFVLIAVLVSLKLISANQNEIYSSNIDMQYKLDATSNFFTQKDSENQIIITDDRDSLTSIKMGYEVAAENDDLILYYHKKSLGIAVYDKVNQYIWYSKYLNKENNVLSDLVKAENESGINIEYLTVDTKGKINTTKLSYLQKRNGKQVGSCNFRKIDKGIIYEVEFAQYGISFNVEITLDEKKINVKLPYESIKEVTVGSLNKQDYKLKSVSLFSSFGANNYLINGYSFIPDGSGALIRYKDNISSTAYIKKIYGNDFGFKEKKVNDHMKDENTLSLPLFGVSHGYNQAAFLCNIVNGASNGELHSYPYMYDNKPYNTTFFKYMVRDTFNVQMTSEMLTLMMEEVYPVDYELAYTFLENEDANYVGMAKTYRETLDLTKKDNNQNIPLHLDILGLDYKNGLFGNDYVVMTKFEDALNIINDLEQSNIKNFDISYLGFNKGGYFEKNSMINISSLLGTRKDFTKLNDYININNYNIDYTINPLTSNDFGFSSNTVKKINLSVFESTLKSSLEQIAYFNNPYELSKSILKKEKLINRLGIKGFNIDNLSACYSYRFNSNAIYREEMIDEIKNELNKLIDYKISTSSANDYLYKYLDNYYNANYESSKFIYETDSVPFIPIVLSGCVDLYMPNINYLSDYELGILRMIEYNIYPSFIITKEEAYKLRYTNFEYLNSTEFKLWKDLIVSLYDKVNGALKYVYDKKIVNHEIIQNGVVLITYDNNVKIIINYNDYKVLDESVDGYSFKVYQGDLS